MTLKANLSEKRELYTKHLSSMLGISFTIREIDIISTIVNHRGEKKIAALLSISPRTVSTHVHNIMLKLGKNSKEHIIDFIEQSGELLAVNRYYRCLLVQAAFEKMLIKIGKTINRIKIDCSINYVTINSEENLLFKQLKDHLNRQIFT